MRGSTRVYNFFKAIQFTAKNGISSKRFAEAFQHSGLRPDRSLSVAVFFGKLVFSQDAFILRTDASRSRLSQARL